VIQGACDPLTTPRPLSPLYDFAADPDAGLSELGGIRGDAIEASQVVLDRLRNSIRPIVMIVEDIHWADDATLDFIKFIGRRVGDSKASVICTYRDDEVGTDHPLRPVLGQLLSLDSTHRMVVPPLTLAAIEALSSGVEIDAEEILRLTDGNAFYVTEVLATGETHPHSVQEAVLARVGRLDAPGRRVVEAVSIAPRSLDIEQATDLVGGSVTDTDQALASGVLVAVGRSLKFRHELARSAVESSLPPARRLDMHLRMLDMLEADHSPDLARLAHHAIRAQRATRIVEYAPKAARAAVTSGAHKQAVSFLQAALEYPDSLGAEEAAAMRVELATELGIVDRPEEAFDHIEEALTHYRATGNDAALARTLVPHSGTRWRFEDATRFRRWLEEALAILEPKGSSAELANAYVSSAYQHMLARRGEDAARDLERARTTVAESAATELEWMIDMLDGTVRMVMGDPDQGIAILRGVARDAADNGDISNQVLALMMLGSGGGEARRYDVAVPALRAGVEHGLSVDQDYLAAYSRAWLARICFEQGQWDDAAQYAALVERESTHRSGIAVLTALSALGRVRVRRGDPRGLELLEEMVELARSHELQHGWNAVCGRAEYFWLRGEPERGRDELESAFRRALETDSEWARGEVGFWMWRLGAIQGPPEGAAVPFTLQMSGSWRQAADYWRDISCPYETALALADGHVDDLLEALEIFDHLGARPMADRVRARLRDMDVESIPRGPTRSTRANPAGLTDRQMEVLELIVEGLSNRDIAERLFVSRKTVEHHVSAVYAKLGVDNRAKAIAAGIAIKD
jgi:DNA-binding CsgD family transcriptional regulator/tetratricopeptide (TPR) repeat protein